MWFNGLFVILFLLPIKECLENHKCYLCRLRLIITFLWRFVNSYFFNCVMVNRGIYNATKDFFFLTVDVAHQSYSELSYTKNQNGGRLDEYFFQML